MLPAILLNSPSGRYNLRREERTPQIEPGSLPWYYYGMKVALSIPDDLFESAETLGKRLGVTRSRLYATALADYVAKHQDRKVTARLNAVYATEDSRLDKSLRRAQAGSIARDSW